MIKLKDIRVAIVGLFIAVLMLLTINTVVYGAETESTSDTETEEEKTRRHNEEKYSVSSYGGCFNLDIGVDTKYPKKREHNIYVSPNNGQKFVIVCVYQECEKYSRFIPVLFAIDGEKLDAHCSIQRRLSEIGTSYESQYEDELLNLNERYWYVSKSGIYKGTYLNIYSNQHEPVGSFPKTSIGFLKYNGVTDNSLLGYDEAVKYAMDTFEEGWDKNLNYRPPEKDENNSKKDELLGYVKDLKCKDLVIKGNNTSDVSQSETIQVFSWASESTTGRKFKDGAYYVQVYLEVAAQYSAHVFGVGGGDYEQYISEKKYLKAVSAYDCEMEINYKEETSLFSRELEELNKKTFGKGCDFVINQYFRIIYKDTNGEWYVGNYLKYGTDTPREDEKRITSEDENGNPTDDSTYAPGSKPNKSYGEGETKDEADKNATTGQGKNIDVNLDWFIYQLKYLKDSLGEFPQLVSEVFGWLPSSVITLIGVGISIMIVIALIRAVRG